MQSRSIEDVVTFLEMEEGLLELYSELHAAGCFKCSTSMSASHNSVYDYADDTECVDICDPNADYSPLSSVEWKAFFSTPPGWDHQMTIDQGCGHAAINALQPVTRSGALPFTDLLHFANSLVYDERTDTCFAFDPRDAYRRRLELLDTEQCEAFDCFDCAYTAG